METSPITVCWTRHKLYPLSLRERAGERGSKKKRKVINELLYADRLEIYHYLNLKWRSYAT